ncbi:MAG: 4-alpha-glucanotransferase [Planctomycetota bacterium]
MGARSFGLLLHPTSLPGPHGIGDLGAPAREFLDFLEAAGARWWQMLPVTPPGPGNSPYQAASAFAGSELLVDLGALRDDGLLGSADLKPGASLSRVRVRYAAVARFKRTRLARAWQAFRRDGSNDDMREFEAFRRRSRAWLEPYTQFRVLAHRNGTQDWTRWRKRTAPGDETLAEAFFQFLFDKQWAALRREARRRRVRLLGDVPIFVAHESADVRAHPELFRLDKKGRPRVVSGVPPDYFSRRGQVWGHPHYDWDELRRTRYRWWMARLRRSFELFDCVRLDHFLGFLRAWEVAPGARTAANGRWSPGPGAAFFRAVRKALPKSRFVAENLGVVTAESEKLRRAFRLPGMRVLQFEEDRLTDPGRNDCVVYTGTHDNDTAAGWYASLPRENRARVRELLEARGGAAVPHGLIAAAFFARAKMAIVPVQDLLGRRAQRLNTPGTAHGNWEWRLRGGALKPKHARFLKELAAEADRL